MKILAKHQDLIFICFSSFLIHLSSSQRKFLKMERLVGKFVSYMIRKMFLMFLKKGDVDFKINNDIQVLTDTLI